MYSQCIVTYIVYKKKIGVFNTDDTLRVVTSASIDCHAVQKCFKPRFKQTKQSVVWTIKIREQQETTGHVLVPPGMCPYTMTSGLYLIN